MVIPVTINGTSMESTLEDGNIALINGLSLKDGDIDRFDIVVAHSTMLNEDIIKRLETLEIITASNAKYLNIDINKENLSEQVFLEEATNYDKMLYKCYALNIIEDLSGYL